MSVELPDPCPVCRGATYVAHGGRPYAVCARCGAMERQRALVRRCADILADGSGRTVLEVAPLNATVFGSLLRERGWHYTSMDRWRSGNPHDPRAVGFVDVESDVAAMDAFSDEAFDAVILQHVIEEVPNYVAALKEIERVLRPGGVALLEIPVDRNSPSSSFHAPDRFGNVWRFGLDLLTALEAVFDRVESRPLEEATYVGEVLACWS